MQTVNVVGQRQSDFVNFASDLARVRELLPNCQINVTYNGSVSTGKVELGMIARLPSGNGSASIVHESPKIVVTCPPKSGIPQNPSN